MPSASTDAVVGTSVAFSFILLGNAITQTYMSVPALLVDFPAPSSPSHPAAARLLGRQWPVFWSIGNVFFRPISTLGVFGYAYASWMARRSGESGFGRQLNVKGVADWKLYAVSAACHLVTVVHSAINMQPLNAKLEGLRWEKGNEVDGKRAEEYARRWAKLNVVRMVMPLVAGSVALWQAVRTC
ncbi:Monooxygenase [Madurella fahalii]|uniref:Monooxygenase n=1 Tax=Madurella fahalii TaxID=1157608 RepID=A0ABQ0GC82_9PEZI